jgi:hypothetical protein
MNQEIGAELSDNCGSTVPVTCGHSNARYASSPNSRRAFPPSTSAAISSG